MSKRYLELDRQNIDYWDTEDDPPLEKEIPLIEGNCIKHGKWQNIEGCCITCALEEQQKGEEL
jgi:hypothetical protein